MCERSLSRMASRKYRRAVFSKCATSLGSCVDASAWSAARCRSRRRCLLAFHPDLSEGGGSLIAAPRCVEENLVDILRLRLVVAGAESASDASMTSASRVVELATLLEDTASV